MLNGGALAPGAVLTWHLNDFVGKGWVGWWLIQGWWVGAATNDTRLVGGLVVSSDFLSDVFWGCPKHIFLRVPKPLSDPLFQVLKTLHKEMYQKKHEEYSWNFTCAHVIHARVFNGGAIACGAVLTWHLNDFVGRGWVGWWLIQGMWVGAATTDTRVVVGGLVVLSDFVPKRFFWGSLSEHWESLSNCPTLWFRFWRLYIKKCTKKKHEEYSWNFTCAHVLHARVFNGGALAPVAVLTWHLNDFVGRGWVGWWLIQGRWVGAATTDTRVVVGGLVVSSDFLSDVFWGCPKS